MKAATDNPTLRGSILVVGGGIAGMQAALDCANAGFKVYLLEKEPAIGGNMARLDKTFPTNDCAMCMISPKLVETGRHLNIEIIAHADLKKIEGQAGDFTVTINRRTRYVDEEKCNGCGDCETVCPVRFTDGFNGELSTRKAIYRLYPQAIPNVFTIDKAAAAPPCRGTCPAGVNAQGYTALIAEGKFLNALDVVRERMPFAGICGRICHHPCETNCNRKLIDQPVAVRHLKRFVADYEKELLEKGESIARETGDMPKPTAEKYAETIAVVGAGPAGLTCAHRLAEKGYRVTVFEKEAQSGGMMRYGIPAYRLPRDYMDHEIGLLMREGITVQYGQTLGRDFTIAHLMEKGFASVFLAAGAPLARTVDIPGVELKGVRYGIPFLHQVNSGGLPQLGRRVVVIGGGNVAMDVARTALRLPGVTHVSLFCLEDEPNMPAYDWEIREAREEGVLIHPGWGPHQLIGDGDVLESIQLKQCLSVFDENRRFNPRFVPDFIRLEPADTVILAIGQQSDLSVLDPQLARSRGVVAVDPVSLGTSMPGVFAGGDMVSGPASLVEAVAQGHRAAESIHQYLRGKDAPPHQAEPPAQACDRLPQQGDDEDFLNHPAGLEEEFAQIPVFADRTLKPRHQSAQVDPQLRRQSFGQIEAGFTPEVAVAEARRCLQCGICSQCKECVRVCKAEAVLHHGLDRTQTLNVGAVILSTGFNVFDPRLKAEYGLGRYPNVVTSMQFERILSASGPFAGHLKRLSDGKVPEKIAWIQCVGSRDVTVGNDYCSGVCCMYASKEAIVAKEHEASVRPTIFYIDMRTFGKGYEGFQQRAKEVYGVRYVRSQISSIKENPFTRNLVLTYADPLQAGVVVEEEFHMVVLSAAVVAAAGAAGLAQITGVPVNRFGFLAGVGETGLRTPREGIFLSGTVSGPKDIPDTVMESSAAAALCAELLHEVRHRDIRFKQYPVETPVDGMEPRVGVFVCHCGINIASVVDVEALTQYIRTVPGVAYAQRFIYTCSQDTQEEIKRVIRRERLNRVIVASCTPRTHEGLFRETLQEAGLNKYLFEMADIREQCSWVHQREPERATEKSKDLVRGSVAKAALLEPLALQKVPVTKAALVIGGGVSGMTAALSLARQGFRVHLSEKSNQLGGNLRLAGFSDGGTDWTAHLDRLILQVEQHPRISIYLESRLEGLSGFVGNFTARLRVPSDTTFGNRTPEDGNQTRHNSGEVIQIKHGVTIVAVGAGEFLPDDFSYGLSDQVVTQRQLEEAMQIDVPLNTVVMIQCVGSRNLDRPYCSRVCCTAAVRNALALKKKRPNIDVYILYRDMNTYGYNELIYRQARELGVRFIHFPDDRYPEVIVSGGRGDGLLSVSVYDTVIHRELQLAADLVVLSTAVQPDVENNQRLASLLKLSLDDQSFFMEAHVKLRPVDFANEGHFVCGLAHSPKSTQENIVQALAAAGRAGAVLANDYLEVGGVVSVVDDAKCAVCLTCVRECVFRAPFIDAEGKARIEAAKCQGCGNCAAACPARAIQLKTFTDDQQQALFKNILTEKN